eukprot:2558644-Rhodomonas_salina.1
MSVPHAKTPPVLQIRGGGVPGLVGARRGSGEREEEGVGGRGTWPGVLRDRRRSVPRARSQYCPYTTAVP